MLTLKNSFALIALVFLIAPGPRAQAAFAELPVVDSVDLARYQGLWYEIARLPQRFESGCAGVTAEYASLANGNIAVTNTCRKGGLDGPVKVAHATARVVNYPHNSKLKVTFFWPFKGDYWILELGENYEYAVVGAPHRGALWILSRNPLMPEAQVASILERRAAQGFDVSRIIRTVQK